MVVCLVFVVVLVVYDGWGCFCVGIVLGLFSVGGWVVCWC